MENKTAKPLFQLGRIVATPAALALLEKAGERPETFLIRHIQGDWGDVCQADREENQFSLTNGLRVLSSYHTTAGDELWIITEPTGLQPLCCSQKTTEKDTGVEHFLRLNAIGARTHASLRPTIQQLSVPISM